MTASSPRKILLVDDDPSHLEIYGMMMKQAGHEALPVLVKFHGAEFPAGDAVSLILLDYRLNSVKTSADLAREMRVLFPTAPIVLLSDLWSPPADIAPFVAGFVRKGEPAKLLELITSLLNQAPNQAGS